jgi:hypothetical protein
MSILYCSLIHNKEKTKIAESSIGKNFKMQIKNILPEIYKNSINDRIEFEDYFLTYTRSKEIIFLCISPKRVGEERARFFIEGLINKLCGSRNQSNKAYASIRDCLEKHNSVKELLIYENDLQKIIDEEIKNFNTGIEDNYLKIQNIQKDVDIIKKDLNKAIVDNAKNAGDLEQLLLTSKKVENLGNEFKKGAKNLEGQTRCCCKPWVVTTISMSVLLALIMIYVIVAVIRCNSYYNAFCSKVEEVN